MRTQHVRAGFVGDTSSLIDAFELLDNCSRATAVSTLRRDDFTMASARYQLDPAKGEGYWEMLRLAPDLLVLVTKAKLRERETIDIVGEDLIEFHFRLSGAFRISDDDGPMDITRGSLLIWRQPEGRETTEIIGLDGELEGSVTIYCRPSFLTRVFGSYYSAIQNDLAELLAPTCDRIRSLHAALYPGLAKLVVDLANVPDRSGIRLVQAEALAIQIVGELLENIELQRQAQSCPTRLSDKDADCLKRARAILLRDHAPPPTVETIAREVGLCRTKLKSGFRAMFGQTISEFANGLRMNLARDMLAQSDKPIAHISAELGYEYQNSFTVAFRRHFGVLPKDYRRDPLAYQIGKH